VSLLEMSAAYEPYICGGNYAQPTLISKITDSNNALLYRFQTDQKPVMDSKNAYQIKIILEKVISEGTGRGAQGLVGESGGKTGTSDENRDAWFIGFHNQYITGVWMGHDRNESLGRSENGGKSAAPIWRDYMKAVSTQ